MSFALAAAIAMSGVLFTGAAAQAASDIHLQMWLAGGPFPYADCIKEVKKQYGTTQSPQAVCNELVKMGWVKKPGLDPGRFQH
ncbi:hypothetical protein [Streptomyces sp. KR80]|uniref:hypothetical protein n=1 Tax=Streptomyces sp. KR80 TaxID=3457426 RepID=UPI003FD2CD66